MINPTDIVRGILSTMPGGKQFKIKAIANAAGIDANEARELCKQLGARQVSRGNWVLRGRRVDKA